MEDRIELEILTGQRPAADVLPLLPSGWSIRSDNDRGEFALAGPEGLVVSVRLADIGVRVPNGHFSRQPSIREAVRRGERAAGVSALAWRDDLPAAPGGPFLMAWSPSCAALVEYHGEGRWSYADGGAIPPTALGARWAAMPSDDVFDVFAGAAELFLVRVADGYEVCTARDAGSERRLAIVG